MRQQNADILIREADQLLEFASHEIERAEEDAATHSVCFNSRQSIVNYLVSYLQKHGTDLPEPVTMASFLEKCRDIDGRFDLIDISNFGCRHDGEHEAYCLDVNKVSDCLRIAKQTRAIAIDEAPAY